VVYLQIQIPILLFPEVVFGIKKVFFLTFCLVTVSRYIFTYMYFFQILVSINLIYVSIWNLTGPLSIKLGD
jgi:hypothetical protein